MNIRQQRISVHMIHVYSTPHFSPYTPSPCLRVWARGDVSLLISSDTTLLTPQVSDKRFPDPALSRHRQLTRLFPVWAASEPGGDQPGYTGVTRVSRLRQSIADSQTCHCFQTPTTKLVVNCHPTQDTACDLHFHQLNKYGLAEPETRWCNSPRSASCSLTFESEHDYLTVRPHHCFGDRKIKTVNKKCPGERQRKAILCVARHTGHWETLPGFTWEKKKTR